MDKTYKCIKCKQIKNVNPKEWKMNSFYTKSGEKKLCRKGELCLDCFNEERREKRNKNKDEVNKKRRLSLDANRDEYNKYQREYRSKNKDKINNKRRLNYSKNKDLRDNNSKRVAEYRKNNIDYYLNTCVGNKIRKGIRDKKGNKTFDILGYSLEDLMGHLESQFEIGMTWDNYGNWHIDHIKPVCSFTFQSKEDLEFKECWSLKNLRPLWAKDNLEKSAKDKKMSKRSFG